MARNSYRRNSALDVSASDTSLDVPSNGLDGEEDLLRVQDKSSAATINGEISFAREYLDFLACNVGVCGVDLSLSLQQTLRQRNDQTQSFGVSCSYEIIRDCMYSRCTRVLHTI